MTDIATALAESMVQTQWNYESAYLLKEEGDSRLWDAMQRKDWPTALDLLREISV